ncbi:MAG: carbohydrate kinase family protein, partial [Candidatus Aminicenantes bacterium]|nr:carbohydrate kinase family protein [Candidatus Aminicenantes bacterium]
MDVVGLGALNVDMVYEVDLASFGLEAGTERIGSYEEFKGLLELLKNKGKLRAKSGGGSAANTIYALAKMGFSCGYLGKVGEDEEGNFLLEDLNKVGVDTHKVKRDKKSGVCLVLLGKSKDRSIIVLPNANDTLVFPELDTDYINEAEFLHMSSFLGKIPFEAQKQIAGETKTKISFNPGEPHATKGLKELTPILKHTFILFLSQKEAEILTGKDYKKGARMLLSYGIEVIACTLGEKGSYLLSRKEEFEVPPEKVET